MGDSSAGPSSSSSQPMRTELTTTSCVFNGVYSFVAVSAGRFCKHNNPIFNNCVHQIDQYTFPVPKSFSAVIEHNKKSRPCTTCQTCQTCRVVVFFYCVLLRTNITTSVVEIVSPVEWMTRADPTLCQWDQHRLSTPIKHSSYDSQEVINIIINLLHGLLVVCMQSSCVIVVVWQCTHTF